MINSLPKSKMILFNLLGSLVEADRRGADDVVAQVDQLRGGVVIHEHTAPDVFELYLQHKQVCNQLKTPDL